MDFFETTIINCILVLFPILLYFIYLIYNYDFNKKANELILDLCLITSYYLLSKFTDNTINSANFLIAIPLLIAYLKERKLSILVLSIISLVEIDNNFFLFILILENISYYILYLIIKNKNIYSIFFWLIKTIVTLILIINIEFKIISLIKYLIIIFISIFISHLIINLFNKIDKIINMYMSLNDLKKETKIQESLFRITHEIKNPIAVCKGYLDMFDINNKEHSQKYVPIIKNEIERTLILLQDFLCLSKIKINREILDLTLLLDETIYEMSLYNEKSIEFIKKYDANDEIYIEGDYNRLKQVLVNIIKNSIESFENSSGKIIIKVIKKKDKIYLTIKDNGYGMDEETLKRITEPFFTTKKRGTGLGVPLSIEIIESHGWTINYSSKINQGTTVEILMTKYE